MWTGRHPASNVAIAAGAMSGVIVFDCDTAAGEKLLLALLAATNTTADTLTITTGRGKHFYYRHPGGTIRSHNWSSTLGIDLKADGGYVVGRVRGI